MVVALAACGSTAATTATIQSTPAPAQPAAAKSSAAPPSGPSFRGGYPACTSRDAFDQLNTAAAQKDRRGFDYLMSHGCITVAAGIPASVLGTEGVFASTFHVRAYPPGGTPIELWTAAEAIAGYP